VSLIDFTRRKGFLKRGYLGLDNVSAERTKTTPKRGLERFIFLTEQGGGGVLNQQKGRFRLRDQSKPESSGNYWRLFGLGIKREEPREKGGGKGTVQIREKSLLSGSVIRRRDYVSCPLREKACKGQDSPVNGRRVGKNTLGLKKKKTTPNSNAARREDFGMRHLDRETRKNHTKKKTDCNDSACPLGKYIANLTG